MFTFKVYYSNIILFPTNRGVVGGGGINDGHNNTALCSNLETCFSAEILNQNML